jgi:hypothetical protein
VNQLLTQTHRRAVSFELNRGNNRLPVGTVTLQLKSADSKSQHYSLCVYFDKKCIELKDRALNAGAVVVVKRERAPLDIATKTSAIRSWILGFFRKQSRFSRLLPGEKK